jgi:hypothetical protein
MWPIVAEEQDMIYKFIFGSTELIIVLGSYAECVQFEYLLQNMEPFTSRLKKGVSNTRAA